MEKFRVNVITILLLIGLTNNAFSQWLKQSFPSNEYLWKVRFVNTSIGWVLSQNHMYKTTDGGVTWTAKDTAVGAGQSLYVVDANIVYYSTYDGVNVSTAKTRRSTDGGSTWKTVDSTYLSCTDMKFVTPELGFEVGGISGTKVNSVIKKTTDGGATWSSIFSDSKQQSGFEGVTFPDTLHGWTVTYNGYVYQTTNGGDAWSLQDSIRPQSGTWLPVRDIKFFTPDSGWAVGGISGTMIISKTTNGGDSWISATSGGSSLREIQLLDSRIGWCIGTQYEPGIYGTVDGGQHWQSQGIIPNNSFGFESISIVNNQIGWAVGGPGIIYKTETGGVTASDNEIKAFETPREFVLDQNYPNPFNPTTNILFSLPSKSVVVLKVYDLLGREVATLVSEELRPGNHSVNWNAKSIPSGVFFYRMQTGSITETKKLILQK